MTESKEHKFLKTLGVLYLHKVKCRLAATEVYVSSTSRSLIEYSDLTNKTDIKQYIDCAGIAMKPVFKIIARHPNGWIEREKIGDEPVTKGIEVKISRNDLNNGYVCTGLNYHYLLVPKGLVDFKEVPTHVGILEYDPKTKHPSANNLIIKRKPRRQKVTDYSLKRIESGIIKRYHGSYMDVLRDQMRLLHNQVFLNEV